MRPRKGNHKNSLRTTALSVVSICIKEIRSRDAHLAGTVDRNVGKSSQLRVLKKIGVNEDGGGIFFFFEVL